MDIHAHISRTEVIGMLGGQYDEQAARLVITLAIPCKSISTGMQCEMDPGTTLMLCILCSVWMVTKVATLMLQRLLHSRCFHKVWLLTTFLQDTWRGEGGGGSLFVSLFFFGFVVFCHKIFSEIFSLRTGVTHVCFKLIDWTNLCCSNISWNMYTCTGLLKIFDLKAQLRPAPRLLWHIFTPIKEFYSTNTHAHTNTFKTPNKQYFGFAIKYKL